jgi:tetratricopeptide (TPR) repeat protein
MSSSALDVRSLLRQAWQLRRDSDHRGMIALLSGLPHGTLTVNLELAHLLSWGLREAGKFGRSLDLQLELEPLFRARGNDWLLRAWLLVATGNHMHVGNAALAEERALECLELASRADDQYAIGWSANNLGAVFGYLGRSAEALVNFQRAAAANHRQGYLRGLAYAFHNIGGVFINRRDWNQALSSLDRAADYSREMADPLLLYWHDVPRAEALLGLGDVDLAEALLLPAEAAFSRMEMRHQQANAVLLLAVCRRLRREYAAAHRDLARALQLARQTGAGLFEAFVKMEIALTEDAAGNTSNAVAAATEARQLLLEFGSIFHFDLRLGQLSAGVRAQLEAASGARSDSPP